MVARGGVGRNNHRPLSLCERGRGAKRTQGYARGGVGHINQTTTNPTKTTSQTTNPPLSPPWERVRVRGTGDKRAGHTSQTTI